MTTPPRLLRTLFSSALLALALLAVGCGVDTNDAATVSGGGSPSTSTTALAGGDQTSTTGAPSVSSTTEAGSTTTEAPTSSTAPRSTTPGLPPGVDRDTIKRQLAIGFKTLGLTQAQADCLADAYITEFGTGSTNPDYTKLFDLMSRCNIDPAQIGRG